MIGGHRHVATAAGRGQRGQCRIVASGQHHMALRIVQKAAVAPQRHRTALRRAHPEHRHAHAGGARLPRGRVGGGAGLIGDQHQRTAGEVGVVDQRHAAPDRQRGVVAVHRHGVGCHRVEQVAEAVRIGSQRRHHEGLAGVADQRVEAVAVAVQQVVRLVAHAIEPARRHVTRQHVPRQRDRQHLRRAAGIQRLRDPVPGRAGQRQRGQRPAAQQQPQRQLAVPGPAMQQMRQQLGVDQSRQFDLGRAAPRAKPRQQRQQRQRGQPPRLQKMELLQRRAHAGRSERAAGNAPKRRRASTSSSSAIAASSGQRNSSCRGRRVGPCCGIGSSASMVR